MLDLKRLTEEDLYDLWQIAYSKADPVWKYYDAPYFQDYIHYSAFADFQREKEKLFVNNPNRLGIFLDGRLVGTVSRYWECQATRWMELGIAIYQERDWGAGIATATLKKWLDQTFRDYAELERLGLTTWSGNPGMIAVAEKLGLQQEACIRKVRYYQGIYYDSIKYGVLRNEYFR